MSTSYKDNDGVVLGHAEKQNGMAGFNKNLYPELDLFFLLEHDFITGAKSGDFNDVNTTYSLFTKEIVLLFHGSYHKSDIHSALIIAEDHLTVILEDSTELDEYLMRFINRAINFIKRYIDRIGEWIEAHQPRDGEVTVVSASLSDDEIKAESTVTIQWVGKFTELVEIIFSILISGKISTETDAEFIRTIFNIFDVKKSLTDYYKALKKIEEKHPKDDEVPGRCKLLSHLLCDTERELQRRYLGKAA